MPTEKDRLIITLPEHLSVFLQKISLRDSVPKATKAAELLERAMEMEEDEFLSHISDERMQEKVQWVSHKDVWSKKKK